jgi:CheY-like chemotaxis protein
VTNWEAEGFEGRTGSSSVRPGFVSSGLTSGSPAFAHLSFAGQISLGGAFFGGRAVCHRQLYQRHPGIGGDGQAARGGSGLRHECSAFHASEGSSASGGRSPVPPPPDRARLLSGLRVLVVEDDEDARELVTAILEDAGAVVEAAESAAAGFAAMGSFRPQLLVSDISMPDEDGYSLIRRVRALADGGDIPSIALTAHTRIEDRAKALRAGFTLHMGKPVRPVDLVAAVKTLATSASN